MLALQITSTKAFMQQLLVGDAFEEYLLESAVICTANTYTIDGRINPEFYPPEERNAETIPYEFRPFSEQKGLCFDLIKGKHTPLSFKFVLQLKPEKTSALLGSDTSYASLVKALVLTVKYDGTHVTLITGIAYNTFSMDREPEQLWDKALTQFLSDKGLPFETL
ncbi:MAG: DUF5721 family protein [Acetatifactor sp.]|nr:DUF5721 family protein [Acetatifactor sp.]